MIFLIDENLPAIVGQIFESKGFKVEIVAHISELRSKSDEVIFEYAVGKKAIIVSRDIGFANSMRFNLKQLSGLLLLRFPNEILISTLCSEIEKSIKDFNEADFRNLMVIEPGAIRKRVL